MKNIKISAAIATFYEEKNIETCIKSLNQFADEIIVVDGRSKDKTASIAKKLGATVIEAENKKMFHINKNLAIKNCHYSWVFLIDADERVTKELALEIKKTINGNPKENGFWINRKNWFLGDYLTKGGAYPDPVIRLFKNGKGILPEISVHEQVKIDGVIGHLKNPLLHFADPNFERYLKRSLRYTEETVQFLAQNKPGKNVFTVLYYMIIKPISSFIKLYVRHKGYQDGFRGFIWAVFSSFHYFYAYVKYWQNE